MGRHEVLVEWLDSKDKGACHRLNVKYISSKKNKLKEDEEFEVTDIIGPVLVLTNFHSKLFLRNLRIVKKSTLRRNFLPIIRSSSAEESSSSFSSSSLINLATLL
jgi:hypothetical protein